MRRSTTVKEPWPDAHQRQLAVASVQESLPELDWTLHPAKVKRFSQDFHWFSPILKAQLKEKQADAVVRPRTESELRKLVSACVAHGLPLMMRGAATGNYGQLVPLQGGIMVDMSGFNHICQQREGILRAQAGIRLGEIEKSARATGWELRCMPSTYRQATLGGLFSGGFGGIGSITYGPLAAAGNVLSIRVMTVEAEPRLLTIPAPQALLLHHTYGTTGIVLEVELALAPCHRWTERLDVFDTFSQALDYANALTRSPGLIKRQVALFAAPIPAWFSHLKHHYQAHQHAVISAVAEESEVLCPSLVTQFGGQSALRQETDESRPISRSLLEYCWNHTTLHALKVDSTLTYLQTAFSIDNYRNQIAHMHELFGDEVISHIEFLRDVEGNITASGLQLVRYSTADRLNEIMDIFREHHIKVNNPHVVAVEDGKQGVIRPEVVSVKHCIDPNGLLNPGKLRGWDIHETLPLIPNPLALPERKPTE
ncbi:FAD-binding oxidoreductase [Pluralibacter gergoviae]|uniref:FAD-binding oxidoreductase n=1 Tax=Pluralibacter gergoviae TaxID=61647 RepID=A0AAI9DMU8_PLUGE|nr:FAD-binding oxidoreductase [Pluralibacter gergoviae]EKV0916511.1 FAD-binding oxidoreductase [Pluralibacter gergoviae]EKV0931426.1 FAD-binding oxidoreductase [Pluralibacter gergoviae]EKV3546054.1 FAD-binding oxidoreductase [Pluralibacter gergoviae]EKV6247870.1 FAD-binding oxidoreductase [Pluralibacter gergoviae]